jgi:hypothetical protein
MATAFAEAGLRAGFDAVGLTGRGVWLARVGLDRIGHDS